MTGSTSPEREAAVEIVRVLRARGHVAYLAGGCVRDRLLGLEPKDYDVATDAPPQRVHELFRHSRYVGEAFGVVLVRLGRAAIEVATFRQEWGYADGRRPDHVEYSDARHDAQRRDFTINGLFEDPVGGEEKSEERRAKSEREESREEASPGRIIDYVGGVADLRAGVLRAIGVPAERFAEDYLRMLRAVRFAARFGFVIEPATAAAIRSSAPRLAAISRERIGQEVQGMLTGPNPALAVKLMQDLGLDGPALEEPHQEALAPTVEGLAGAAPPAGFATVLAAWLLDRHWGERPRRSALDAANATATTARSFQRFVRMRLPEVAETWRHALCLSNEVSDGLLGTLELAARGLRWPGLGVAGRKRLLAEPLWSAALALLRALRHHAGVPQVVEAIDADVPGLVQSGVAPVPQVTGADLIALGRPPGPRFKTLLDAAYDRQLDGRLPDRAAALAWLARQKA